MTSAWNRCCWFSFVSCPLSSVPAGNKEQKWVVREGSYGPAQSLFGYSWCSSRVYGIYFPIPTPQRVLSSGSIYSQRWVLAARGDQSHSSCPTGCRGAAGSCPLPRPGPCPTTASLTPTVCGGVGVCQGPEGQEFQAWQCPELFTPECRRLRGEQITGFTHIAGLR